MTEHKEDRKRRDKRVDSLLTALAFSIAFWVGAWVLAAVQPRVHSFMSGLGYLLLVAGVFFNAFFGCLVTLFLSRQWAQPFLPGRTESKREPPAGSAGKGPRQSGRSVPNEVPLADGCPFFSATQSDSERGMKL